MKYRLHIIVEGLVQGVFFRSNTKKLANELLIKGWVKNIENNKVEVLAEGERKALETLLEFCKKGPDGALVEKTEFKWKDYKGVFKDFKILD